MTLQIAVRTEGPEDVLGATDQQPSQVGVTRLGDAQLLVEPSGLVTPRNQAQIGAHITWVFETLRIFDG